MKISMILSPATRQFHKSHHKLQPTYTAGSSYQSTSKQVNSDVVHKHRA